MHHAVLLPEALCVIETVYLYSRCATTSSLRLQVGHSSQVCPLAFAHPSVSVVAVIRHSNCPGFVCVSSLSLLFLCYRFVYTLFFLSVFMRVRCEERPHFKVLLMSDVTSRGGVSSTTDILPFVCFKVSFFHK